MRNCALVLFLFLPFIILGQASSGDASLDEKYLEDQFYAGFTYNFILNRNEQVNQRNFSYGIQAGFIKDMPLNRSRTIGLGIGIGLALNTYYTNIRATESSGVISYSIPNSSESFRRNKLETHVIEMPFQFRWRNSDASTYSFWRIYTGVKLGYAYDSRSKFVTSEFKDSFSNTDVRKLQYGLTLNVGYHNFNMHVYYSLQPLFKDTALLANEPINIRPLQVGFMFYIL